MLRSRSLAAVALGSLLTLVGCKQDLGDRCEKSSDCASGYCGGDNSDTAMLGVSKVCTAGRVTSTPDAGPPPATPDAAQERADAADATDAATAEAGDVASDSHAEAGEAGGDTGTEAGTDAAPSEGGGDTSSSDAAPGLSDAGGDAAASETSGN
jgi:hypothetical protein